VFGEVATQLKAKYSMTLQLYAKRAGEGPAVILLHGLFGAGGNLGALARDLQKGFAVFSVDLPNHGRSGWLVNPDLAAMADSVRHWMDEAGLSRAHLIGHSLGGKVAMQMALRYPRRVESLVVADIAPVSYTAHHDAVFAALEAVAAGECSSRDAAAKLMAFHLQEEAVIQFLLTSLQRDARGIYSWRFDLSGIRDSYSAMLAAPQVDQSYTGPVLFIKGGASDYIGEQHWPAIQALFPEATIKVMPDCGHWLHVEKPQLFNGIVARFLAPLKQRMLTSKNQGQER
jgi:esterase